MHQSLYFMASAQTLDQYACGEEDPQRELARVMECHGCDGLEVIRCGDETEWVLRPELIRGVHMGFYSYWLDFWRGDRQAWLREFGSEEVCRGFYGGVDREDMLTWFQEDLRFAAAVGAEYVVFHVSDVTLEETFTRRYHHSAREVVDASAEVINRLLDGAAGFDGEGPPYFLMENLQWPGLTMTEPELTERLLAQVEYPGKGIMLDLGHLMCCEPAMDTEEECLGFVHSMLDAHGELCRWIKGVHMHQSHSGVVSRYAMADPPVMERDYYARFAQAYRHVGRVDTHQPMTCPGTRELISRIAPEFLTHELMGRDRWEQEELLRQQTEALSR